eukprot:scaffold1827_cov421-Prasinococcus_capsulatus_cf.AAC.48
MWCGQASPSKDLVLPHNAPPATQPPVTSRTLAGPSALCERGPATAGMGLCVSREPRRSYIHQVPEVCHRWDTQQLGSRVPRRSAARISHPSVGVVRDLSASARRPRSGAHRSSVARIAARCGHSAQRLGVNSIRRPGEDDGGRRARDDDDRRPLGGDTVSHGARMAWPMGE